jgi:DNA-binding response OmpR family regulator
MFQSHDNGQDLRDGVIRILVVDDEPTLRLGFKYTLSSETTAVSTAENGRIAIEMVTQANYDLMILDLRMPDIDGIDVIKVLRAHCKPIPIILCSAGFTARAALGAIRNGVVDFLIKPLLPLEIRNAVESILNPKQGPLENALKAVRRGAPNEAIRILQDRQKPSPLEVHWLRVLQIMRDSDPYTDANQIEKKIGASFSLLAMNAPATE